MLKFTMLEVLLITIPEVFLFILGVYFLSGEFLNNNKIIILTVLSSFIIYVVRTLPIHYGTHILINIICLIFLLIKILKISSIKAISYTMFLIIILCICEFINLIVVNKAFKVSLNRINFSPCMKILYFTPSLVLFGLCIWGIYIFIYRDE